MSTEPDSEYVAEQRETVAEVPGLRVRLLSLGEGQRVPWHIHTSISDTFFCMLGPMRVVTKDPDETHILEPGDSVAVSPGVAHCVEPTGTGCKFILVQGIGPYDYVPIETRKCGDDP